MGYVGGVRRNARAGSVIAALAGGLRYDAYTGAMQAIVSEIDDPYRDAIENIWGELKAVFGLQGVSGSTHPHVTYQVAESYDDRIGAILRGISTGAQPFAIETHGIGIFRGGQIVIYLHVTRSDALDDMHDRIWRETAVTSTGIEPVYAAATWVPHITLAIGDVPGAQLPAIAGFLNTRPSEMRIPVTSLSLIPDTASATAPWRRHPLRGASDGREKGT